MNIKEKELLLKDLCARLPYGVIGLYTWKCKNSYDKELTGILYDELQLSWSYTEYSDSEFLPYLRSMSSMTEEEKKELLQISNFDSDVDDICYDSICCIERTSIDIVDIAIFISWLNAHHFDYLGLIPKGLAIEVSEENNPYKE